MILQYAQDSSHHESDIYNSQKPSTLKFPLGIVARQFFIIKGKDAENREDVLAIILRN